MLCTVALLVTMAPVSAFAESGGGTDTPSVTVTYDVKNVTKPDSTIATAGDEIEVDVYAASNGDAVGLLGFALFFGFDSDVLETTATGNLVWGDYAGAVTEDEDSKYETTFEKGNASVMLEPKGLAADGTTAEKITNQKMFLLSYKFKVKDAPAQKAFDDNLVTIDISEFYTGENFHDESKVDSAIPTIVAGTTVSADWIPPTTSLGDNTNYYYQPVEFTVSDNKGIQRVTLDGNELTATNGVYSMTAGGHLVVTDTYGNSAACDITIDATAFNAAKEAVAKIPETVKYTDKATVNAAETALANVTDPEAAAKLSEEKNRVDAAKAALGDIDAKISGLNTAMAALKPTADNVDALTKAKGDLEALKALGVTENDLNENSYANFQKVDSELKALADEVAAFNNKLDALGTSFTYADAAALSEVEKQAESLKKKGYNLEAKDPERNTKLENLKQSRTKVENAKAALIQKISAASFTIDFNQGHRSEITSIRQEVNAFVADSKATFTDSELEKLTKAEADVKALDERLDAEKKALNDLPEKEDVKLTQKSNIENVASEKAALKALEASFDSVLDQKLADAQAAIAAIEAKIQEVKQNIAAYAGLNPTDGDSIAKFNALKESIDDLLNNRGVTKGDISNYVDYETLAAKFKTAQDDVNAVVEKINTLPEAKDVKLTSKAKITEVEQEIQSLQDKYDSGVPSATQLKPYTDAKAKLTELENQRTDIVAEVANAQLTIDRTEASRNAIAGLRKKVDDFDAYEPNFTEAELKNLTDAENAMKTLDSEVNAVIEQINALPDAADVKFDSKADIEKVAAAIDKLETDYSSNILTGAEKQRYTDAKKALDDLNTKRSEIVEKIANSNFAIDLTTASQDAVTAMRQEVTDFEPYGPNFTEEELKKLTDAENAMTELKSKSKALHKQISELPAGDKVDKYKTYSNLIDQIEKDFSDLQKKGDSLSAEETGKIQAVKDALAAIKKTRDDLVKDMGAASDAANVKYSDKDAVANLTKRENDLKAQEVTLDEKDTNVKHFRNLTTAVSNMEKELADAKSEMDKALKDWHYSADQAPYDAIRTKMDGLKNKYGLTDADFTAEFPNYNTSRDLAAEAEDKIADAKKQLAELPTADKATLSDETAVNKADAAVKELRNKYGVTEKELEDLFGSDYKKLKAGAAKIAELKAAQNAASNNSASSNNTNNNTAKNQNQTAAQEYTYCEACGHNHWTKTEEGYRCDYCGHITLTVKGPEGVKGYVGNTVKPAASTKSAIANRIPQTSDSFPYAVVILLMAAGLLGVMFFAYKKKKL